MERESRLNRVLAIVLFVMTGTFAPIVLATDDRELFRDPHAREVFGPLWTTGVGGRGTATIDGAIRRDEWRHAGTVDFVVNVPGGGKTPATLFVMNDHHNLYIALKFKRQALDAGNTLAIELDANNDGVLDAGDDGFLFNPDLAAGFSDLSRTLCQGGQAVCALPDTDLGGTNDGAGAIANDGTYTTYELSHPLRSGDSQDIALRRGDRVGIIVRLRMIAVPNNDIADTDLAISNLFWAKIHIH